MPASGDARKSWGSTRVAQQLGIDYPIILSSSAISEVIAEIRSLTSKPFAISLGRTAQRQRAHRDVAAAGVGRGGSVPDPPRRGRPPAGGKPGPVSGPAGSVEP